MKKIETFHSCYYGEMLNVMKKILLLSDLSLFESESIFSQKIISERKK